MTPTVAICSSSEDVEAVEVFAREGENSLLAMARSAGWMVYSLMNHLSLDIPRVFYRGGVPVALREPGVE